MAIEFTESSVFRRFGDSARVPWFVVRAWVLAPVVELGLRFGGLKRTLAAVDRWRGEPSNGGAIDVERGERLVQWAFRAHRLLPGQCLARAIVQYGLHRADGTPARFVVGVGDERLPVQRGHGLDAHAWVERLDDEQPRPHTPLYAVQFPDEATSADRTSSAGARGA